MMGFRYYYGQEIEIELGDSVYVGTILTFPNRLGRMEVKINDSVYLIKRKNLIEDE